MYCIQINSTIEANKTEKVDFFFDKLAVLEFYMLLEVPQINIKIFCETKFV